MNTLIIFGSKYLYLVAIATAVLYFLTQPRKVKKKIIILGLVSLPLIYIAAKLAGLLHYNPRPFAAGNFTPLIPHADDNGFPSDHTLMLAAIASIIYPFSKKISALLWVLALAVGFSRVYAGIHHPIDIFGSIVIAVVISVLVRLLLKKRGMV
ncbi:MAG: phosphatase family protein [Parcubacteria group bacterium]|nr:phosphatase family protein [Parcubacteria group bacterium]